jgi:hypothetical protein
MCAMLAAVGTTHCSGFEVGKRFFSQRLRQLTMQLT